MDDATATATMARFGKAFFKKDRDALRSVLTEDAQWHFAIGSDGPDGRVRTGVDGFLRGIEENAAMFESLRFEDVECRGFGDDQIVMTYVVTGRRVGGARFALRGVELLRVRDGRIALKDVFWKQLG